MKVTGPGGGGWGSSWCPERGFRWHEWKLVQEPGGSPPGYLPVGYDTSGHSRREDLAVQWVGGWMSGQREAGRNVGSRTGAGKKAATAKLFLGPRGLQGVLQPLSRSILGKPL